MNALKLDIFEKIYLHMAPVDGRKNISGLGIIVEQQLKLDPFGK